MSCGSLLRTRERLFSSRYLCKIFSNAFSGVSGRETAAEFKKGSVKRIVRMFRKTDKLRILAAENGINDSLFPQACGDFKTFLNKGNVSDDLKQAVLEISEGKGHVVDLFSHFLAFAKTAYPVVDCHDELKFISDLTKPTDWCQLFFTHTTLGARVYLLFFSTRKGFQRHGR
eukprot:m.173125 g.173125  ORF g.173125 m.173125 type:complete len:172 (+) comp39093_c0_seq8:17-532(+)